MPVLVDSVLAELGDERDEQPRVAQGVEHVVLAQVVRVEAADGLDELLRRGAVVVRGWAVLEAAALPRDARRVGAAGHYFDATSMASARVKALAYSALPTIAPSTP